MEDASDKSSERRRHCDILRSQSAQLTLAALVENRSLPVLLALMQGLRDLADQELPMVGVCAGCVSGSSPVAFVSELAAVQNEVQSWSGSEVVDLLDRCREYRRERMTPQADRTVRARCPFMVEGKCLLCKVRTFGTRIDKPDSAGDTTLRRGEQEIHSMEMGHAVALRLLRLDHHRVELGMALPDMLAHPDWTSNFLAGKPALREYARFLPARDFAIEEAKAITRRREASGFTEVRPAIEHANYVASVLGMKKAQNGLAGGSALEVLYRLRVPMSYSSEEEIDEWRADLTTKLSALDVSQWDPVDSFDALSGFTLFGLAYQGRSVRAILGQAAGRLIEPIVDRALPDLRQPIEPRKREGRIRVGYLSCNMKFSNATMWARGWISGHGEDFETFVFSTAVAEDVVTGDFREFADHFYYCPGDIPYTARFIKSLELDVLIFPDIGISGPVYQYAAMRLAPIQCTAWGHPVTSGLSTIDYYLSSELMEPEGAQSEYTEKLVLLKGSGLVISPREKVETAFDRSKYGLGKGFLLFAPNYTIKAIPKWDTLLAEVSEELKTPLVFIKYRNYDTSVFQKRLDQVGCRSFALPELPYDEFSRMMIAADLLIDFPAWSGGNTTLGAIAYRKPLVTLPGEFMRGRHSLAFMKQAGMDPLIASSPADFVRLAKDQELHARTMENANIEAPFHDQNAAQSLNDWIRKVVNGQTNERLS